MQLTSLSLALTRAGFLQFSPDSLFMNGEQGVWYEPSLTNGTCFQDSAGTQPVTAVEQPVGLMLDKSKGLVLGPELVTNGDFSNGTTGWNIGAGWSIGSGVATGSAASTDLYTNPTVGYVQGRIYKVQLSILSVTAGSIRVWIAGIFGPVLSTAGQHTFYVTAGPNNFMSVLGSGFSGTIDNISVRELPGNHAFQTTSTSRPVLSARYNLLTKTEQFDDAVWTKSGLNAFGSGSVANTTATADPLGGNTADFIQESTAANSYHFVNLPYTVASGVSVTHLCHAKAGQRTKFQISGDSYFANFDLVAGTVLTQSNCTAFITSVGNGWYRCSVLRTATGSESNRYFVILNDSSASQYTGDGTSGIYIWGADLRVTNDAAGQPAYQRVNTATDYDTTGFKPYLRFDGTDDWLQTNSINFTGTDKMTVFAGVRKLSDAATGMIVELSAVAGTNAGTFYLAGPWAAGTGSYRFISAGTTTGSVLLSSGYSAPITDVLSGIGNIGGDVTTLRVDGVQAGTDTADQGTGNYGNYPLYIGRRGGATLPFNGRIYGLIIVGRALTASEIANTEKWMAGKTGVTLA